MQWFFQSLPRRRIGFQITYFVIGSIGLLWIATALQAGPSGIFLFVRHDVAPDPARMVFILGFTLAFLVAFLTNLQTLKVPQFNFFNHIIAINLLTYSFLGLALSTLRLPLVSREVFLSEFFASSALLVAYYLLKNRLFPLRTGVLHGAPLEPFRRHPALDAQRVGPTGEHSGNFELVIANLRGEIDPRTAHLLVKLAQKRIPVHDVDSFIEALWGHIPLGRLTAAEIEAFLPPPLYQRIKRIGELALIFCLLPLIAILALAIAIAIRLDSPGPVLFQQQRTGFKGASFTMFKFRSMIVNDNSGISFAEKKDKRITRVGVVLRHLRLDELPQLWNVVRGEMSLIGPRPEQEQFTKRFNQLIPFYEFRHTIPPGISGWAQVMHGYAASDEQTRSKLEFDFYYIKHMSAWLDMVILIKTLRTIIIGSGSR
jgi:UDP-GalNAc:undecaprenyl-phosphate GalNAc-1-phosphate transferase